LPREIARRALDNVAPDVESPNAQPPEQNPAIRWNGLFSYYTFIVA